MTDTNDAALRAAEAKIKALTEALLFARQFVFAPKALDVIDAALSPAPEEGKK